MSGTEELWMLLPVVVLCTGIVWLVSTIKFDERGDKSCDGEGNKLSE